MVDASSHHRLVAFWDVECDITTETIGVSNYASAPRLCTLWFPEGKLIATFATVAVHARTQLSFCARKGSRSTVACDSSLGRRQAERRPWRNSRIDIFLSAHFAVAKQNSSGSASNYITTFVIDALLVSISLVVPLVPASCQRGVRELFNRQSGGSTVPESQEDLASNFTDMRLRLIPPINVCISTTRHGL